MTARSEQPPAAQQRRQEIAGDAGGGGQTDEDGPLDPFGVVFTGVQAGDIAEGAAVAVFLFPLLVAVAIVFLRVARRTEVV